MRAPAPRRGVPRRGVPRRGALALLGAAPLALAGCTGVSMPGQGEGREYKGPADPALMSLPPEAESALSERFERVQAR